MFADDTKVWRVIETDLDCDALQMDIDALLKWSDQWLIRFNPQKCKVMSLGHSRQYNYVMADAAGTFVIERTTEERDLGVIITDNLKPTSQCVKAAAKARSVGILGVVRSYFKRLDPQDFLIIYKSFIRPHLEYCIQAWSPYQQKNICCLESVQRAATRLVRGFRNVPYEDRLHILGLTTLAVRRKRSRRSY